VSTGVAVATNYYAQPLLAAIGHTLHLHGGEAGLVVTASQLGYVAGLVLLVPLGDLVERRGLVVIMSLVAAGGLIGAALAPNLAVLFLFAALVGANSWLRSSSPSLQPWRQMTSGEKSSARS
jgi:MFS family permease